MSTVHRLRANPENADARAAISAMETPIHRAQDFARMLFHLSESPHEMERSVLYTLGAALQDDIGRVKKEWETAFQSLTGNAP